MRCLKCQGWNHFAKDCIEDKDTCGSCAGPHRTSRCLATEKACVSCKPSDHASWSRTCLTFAKKLAEFNIRNPDNSLQYFPTADTWSWTAIDKPPTTALAPAPAPTPPQASATATQGQLSKVQLGKRPQQPRRMLDSYVLNYNYNNYNLNHNYSNRFSMVDSVDSAGWGGVARPSNPRPIHQAASPVQSTGVNSNGSNRNSNLPSSDAWTPDRTSA